MWRITVKSRSGTTKSVQTSDQFLLRELVLSFSPGLLVIDGAAHWSMKGGKFTAVPSSIGAVLHDWITIEVKKSDYVFLWPDSVGEVPTDPTGQWVPLATGEVLQVGDPSVDYRAMEFGVSGGETRLQKTYITAGNYPQGEASLMLQQATEDVLTSGQAGSVLRYDPGFFPTLGVTVGDRTPNGEPLASLITATVNQAAQVGGQELFWGSTQQGFVFAGPIDSGKLLIDERVDQREIEWGLMQGADTCTAVYWLVTLPSGNLPGLTAHTYLDGTKVPIQSIGATELSGDFVRFSGNLWKTVDRFWHLSALSPANPDQHTIGRHTPWDNAREIITPSVISPGGLNPENAVDGDASTYATVMDDVAYGHVFSSDYYPVQVTITYSCDKDWTDASTAMDAVFADAIFYLRSDPSGSQVAYQWGLPKTADLDSPVTRSFVILLDQRIPEMQYNRLTCLFYAMTGVNFRLYDLKFEYVRYSLIDGLSREHWVTPPANAGSARVVGSLALPVASVDLTREDGSTVSDVPVELVEWTIGESDCQTVFKFGEIDPRRAAVLANEALRRQKNQSEGTSAVISSRGGNQ